MSFENLPGMISNLIDGNLITAETSQNPVVLVIGTAPKGDSETFYRVDSVSDAASAFGKNDGTLIRGMYEAIAGGAENVRLMRIGAESATLTGIGATDGLTVETLAKDVDAGLQYKLFWDDALARLRIWRVSDDVLVYDN